MRLDPLNNEWVVIASHRQGRVFLPPKELNPLAPSRPGFLTEIPESDYEVVVFDNRSPSLRPPEGSFAAPENPDFDSLPIPAAGKCEVVCFTSDYDASFKDLSHKQIRTVLEAWRDRTKTARMFEVANAHHKKTGRVLLDDIVKRELNDEVRIVAQNSEWVAYVPYASRYPFEIHVAPRRSVADFVALDDAASESFAPIAKEVLQRLDGVFGVTMPYIASWHQAPVRQGRDVLRLHWQIQSVRRAPGKLKYLAGSESAFGAFMMDLKPEQSAQQLRDVAL